MSVIYKIYCKDENIKDCYIGSTNNLKNRKWKHKSDCNNINSKNYNFKVYVFIRANDGWDNFDFIILEQFENIMTKKDLLKIEGQYIKNNNTTLNYIIAGRTLDEYKEDNKTIIKEKRKKNYEENKEKLLEKQKIYREKHKTEILKKQKIYRENNKTKIAETDKKNYEENKEKILEKQKEKIECEFCKSLIRKIGLKRHQRTKKCIKK